MSIMALYLFLKDGRCAFSQTYSADAPSPDYFGPLFAALDSFAKATIGQEMQGLEFGDIRVNVSDFGLYYVLVATDPSLPVRSEGISALLDQIGFKFWEMHFQDIGEWDGNVRRFSDFHQVCREIMNMRQGRTLPTKTLDGISIIELEKTLRKTALAVLEKDGEATISDISKITSRPESQEQKKLETLASMGYIGRDMKGSKIYYFIDKHGDK